MAFDIETLKNTFNKDRCAIERARLRVLVRFEPPDEKEDFGTLFNPGSYWVSQETGTIQLLWNGEAAFSGPMQIVGTFNVNDETWLWPWNNRSVLPERCAKVKALCESTPELEDLAGASKVAATAEFADLMAGWIGLKMNAFGVYAAEYPDQPIVFVAVEDLEPKSNVVYCTSCFGNQNDGPIVRYAEGLGLCVRCGKQCWEIFEGAAAEQKLSFEDYAKTPESHSKDLDFPPCLICGEYDHLIHGSHAAVCASCVLAAEGQFRP